MLWCQSVLHTNLLLQWIQVVPIECWKGFTAAQIVNSWQRPKCFEFRHSDSRDSSACKGNSQPVTAEPLQSISQGKWIYSTKLWRRPVFIWIKLSSAQKLGHLLMFDPNSFLMLIVSATTSTVCFCEWLHKEVPAKPIELLYSNQHVPG